MDAYLERGFEKEYDWLIWIDADTITKKKFPKKELLKILGNCEIAHLGRTAIDYSETGFIAFKFDSLRTKDFMVDFEATYLSGEVFGYREWTDAFVFTRLLKLHTLHGLIANDLSLGCKDLNAFEASPLIEYLYHKKGDRKYTSSKESPTQTTLMSGRYKAVEGIIKEYKLKNLVEIGTWNGDRAIQMARTALENADVVHYTGFDLFEEATDATDKKEFNVKEHFSEEEVSEKLTKFAETVNKQKDNKKFTYCLFKGNTRTTLKILNNKDTCNLRNIKPDFVFVDGGHSVETISSDYRYVKDVDVLLFDDYYRKDEKDKIPDIEKVGCNTLFDSLEKKGAKKFLINSDDRVSNGGFIGLGVVLNNPKLNLPDFSSVQGKTPIKVKPKDCMPDEYIHNNIELNTPKFKKWVNKKCRVNSGEILVVSAGPSLKKHIPKIKAIKRDNPDAKILCVKHALPLLIKNKIFPWGCIILDPRAIEGMSTHGVKRKSLFSVVPKQTNFFIASMSDTTIVDLLLSKSDNVYGWHAYSDAVRDYAPLKNTMLITGGTCAAMRTLGLMYTLGFRKFKLFGFDSSLEKEPSSKEKKQHQYFQVGVGERDDKHWTTGELLAMAQDFEQMITRQDVDMDLEVYGGGLVQSIWEDNKYSMTRPHYEEIFKKND